jgi:xylulokinase
MHVLIGVDIGTHSTKAVACDLSGTPLATSRIDHTISSPRPGWAEHDADAVWWRESCRVIRRLMSQLPAGSKVMGAAVGSLSPCIVPVDPAGSPLRAGILYQIDSRARTQVKVLTQRCGEDAIVALCGAPLSCRSIGPKIVWLRENEPDVFRKTARYLTASGYVVHKMTGAGVVDKHMASFFAPFVDIAHRRWDLRWADGAVAERQLPQITECHEVAGRVLPDAAAATGLPLGTPVAVGTADGLMEALALGMTSAGEAVISYGSALDFTVLTAPGRALGGLSVSASPFGPETVASAGVPVAGSLTSWFCRELAGGARASSVGDRHGKLIQEAAASPPGARGVVVVPPSPSEEEPGHGLGVDGLFAGLGLTTTRGDIYRAVLEGVAFALRDRLEAWPAPAWPTVVRSTGGGTTTDLWPQIVSDVTNVEQELPVRAVSAASGAAAMAGLSVGALTLEDIRHEWIPPMRRIVPDSARRAAYDESFSRYRLLRQAA